MDCNYKPPLDGLCRVCESIVQQNKLSWNTLPDELSSSTSESNFYDEIVDHHRDENAMLDAVKAGCHLCSLLWLEMQRMQRPSGQFKLGIHHKKVSGGYEVFCNMLNACGKFTANGPGNFGLYGFSDFESRVKHLPWRNMTGSSRTVSTASSETLELAQRWLATCRSNHSMCGRQGLIDRVMPSRLLRLSQTKDGKIAVRLSEESHLEQVSDYLTLSYCWGKADFLTLKRSNRDQFLRDVPFGDLPLTFQHAIEIAVRLGFSAIWIDALCIVQDDLDDWNSEAELMGLIYGNSVCTIAVLSETDSHGGCYQKRYPLAQIPCKLKKANGAPLYLASSFVMSSDYERREDPLQGRSNLFSRGWTVQERVISPRTLYFGRQGIYWECHEKRQSEVPRHYLSKASLEVDNTDWGFMRGSLKGLIGRIIRNPGQRSGLLSEADVDAYEVWWKIVEHYSDCNLSRPTDRWPAMEGIARVLERPINSLNICGLWKRRIISDMLWASEYSAKKREDLGQPSWSWTSTLLEVKSYASQDYSQPLQTLCADIAWLPDPESCVAMRIRAPMLQCRTTRPYERNALYFMREKSVDLFLSEGNLGAVVGTAISNGEWLPDIEVECGHDVWVLQWARGSGFLSVLIVEPTSVDGSKWMRLGVAFFRWNSKRVTGLGVIGDEMTIDLY